MKEVDTVENKKGSGFVIFLLCLAFLLIGAGLMYYYLIVYQGRNNNTEVESDVVSLNTNGVLVSELISRIDLNNKCGVNPELYKKSNTTVETFDKKYLLRLVAKEARGKNLTNNIQFSKEDFDKSIKVLFGENVNLSNESIDGCPNISYDSANQRYTSDASNNCNVDCKNIKYVRHIVKAEKTTDNIYIYVAVAAYDELGKKVLNINDSNSVIQGIDGSIFDISVDFEKVNNYKYTFNYDKDNNNYIFKSIELDNNK